MQIYAVIPQALAKTSSPTFGGATITGCAVLGLNSTVFQPITDSTTFFRVNDKDGNVIANADTVNNRWGFGTVTPSQKVEIVGGLNSILKVAGNDGTDATFPQFIPTVITIFNEHTNVFSGTGINFSANNSGSAETIFTKIHSISTTKTSGSEDGAFSFINMYGGTLFERVRMAANGNFGVGETDPETLSEWTHANPDMTWHGETHSDANNATAGKHIWKREDGAGTETTAFQFEPSHDGAGANDQLAKGVWSVNTGSGLVEAMRIDSNKVVTIPGIGGSGLTGYDLKVGDTSTPDYGLIQTGNAAFGRVPYNAMNMDLDGSVIIRNLGAPATSNIEFAFLESGGTSVRFALGKSGVGLATYSARSMLIAGPSVWDDTIVTVGYWQTNNSIFDNLVCDTAGSGAELGVQGNVEFEKILFVDDIQESTSGSGVTIADNVIIGDGTAATDFTLTFDGETNDGVVTWMEDEDYFKFSDDLAFADAEFLIMDKASGNGIKVDTATPTFGFADLLGDVTVKNTGGSRPALIAYRDGLFEFEFAAGEEEYFKYHIPHDYVKGTDIFLHYHWSTNGALVNGGTVTFDYEMSYAKAHAQAAFPASVSGTIVSATASSTQYTQELTEVQVSASTPSGSQIDTDDLEPDGIIICTAGLNANNLTVSGGGVPDPFIHYIDIHYQTTGLIGTKAKAPDFYA